nr:hypothetical protein [Mammaliicoccus sp. Marseille-Q6498]
MLDMINIVKSHLLKNDVIATHCTGRIRAYHYDETSDTKGPYILISPLMPPQPTTYASDKNLTMEYLYQIDVRTDNEKQAKMLSEEIRKTMWTIGFRQQRGGLDDYDHTVNRFLDARRYLGKPYTIEGLQNL